LQKFKVILMIFVFVWMILIINRFFPFFSIF
jgi:hypothetical protein